MAPPAKKDGLAQAWNYTPEKRDLAYGNTKPRADWSLRDAGPGLAHHPHWEANYIRGDDFNASNIGSAIPSVTENPTGV